jgi:hypothetical protein
VLAGDGAGTLRGVVEGRLLVLAASRYGGDGWVAEGCEEARVGGGVSFRERVWRVGEPGRVSYGGFGAGL